MTLYYSPQTGGFYDEAIHGERSGQGLTLIPADAVAVSRSVHAELMAAQATGKVIVAGADGPIAADPVMTAEQIIAQNRARRDQKLAQSDWTQMPDALQAEPDFKAAMAVWRQELRDLDLAGGIFPEQPTR